MPKLKARLHALPLAMKMSVIVAVFVATQTLLLLIDQAGLEAISATRAFVAGEARWSKAQKDSVYALRKYAASGDESDYLAYLDAVAQPLGVRRARRAMEAPDPDPETAFQAFVVGGSDPDDARLMIRVYRWVRHFPPFARAVEIWAQGDAKIDRLHDLAAELRRDVLAGRRGDELAEPLAAVDRLNEELAALEDDFAATLGAGSRFLLAALRATVAVAMVVLLAAAIYLSWLLTHQVHRSEQALSASERRYRALAENSAVGIWHITPDGYTIYVNPAMQEMLEVESPADLEGKKNNLFVTAETLETMEREQKKVERGGASAYEAQIVGRNGRRRTVLVSGAPILSAQGRLESLIGTFIDITGRKSAERLLEHRALHDPLTDLPNRNLFMDRLEQALARARRQESTMAVLFLDLDRFKVVNDSLGHATGDNLLVTLSRRLAACVREADTVARLGGDEFAVLLEEMRSPQVAVEAAERIAAEVRSPLDIAGTLVRITASVGIALLRAHWERAEDLLRYADIAMYVAKRKGGGGYHVFDPISDSRETVLLQIESDLWQAVANDQIRVHYQPIVSLATGRLAGVEALARWRHPQRGLLLPDDFIPLAEETGAIVAIGQCVLHEACRQQAEWAARFPAETLGWMSVNLSARQFRLSALPEEIAATFAEHAVAPATMRLEITETLLMQVPEAVGRLKRLGTRITIDDFGTGYSSLGILNRISVDGLKIDRSFVDALGRTPGDTALVTAVIQLARALGLEVTAEGIETAEQLALLRRLGCDYGQGHYFARPLSADDLAAMLAADPRW
jgi:diguanylate cyclase (GGDEF)-like protein/PAS domain S-box-containing protein